MPCYTEWDAYLNKGSEEYRTAKKKLEAQLKSVQHIIDYYHAVNGLSVPLAKHSGQRSWVEMAHSEFLHQMNDSELRREQKIIESIAHHCSCDGIRFTRLYDLVTLLDIHDEKQGGYARVIMACANEIRANKAAYNL